MILKTRPVPLWAVGGKVWFHYDSDREQFIAYSQQGDLWRDYREEPVLFELLEVLQLATNDLSPLHYYGLILNDIYTLAAHSVLGRMYTNPSDFVEKPVSVDSVVQEARKAAEQCATDERLERFSKVIVDFQRDLSD